MLLINGMLFDEAIGTFRSIAPCLQCLMDSIHCDAYQSKRSKCNFHWKKTAHMMWTNIFPEATSHAAEHNIYMLCIWKCDVNIQKSTWQFMDTWNSFTIGTTNAHSTAARERNCVFDTQPTVDKEVPNRAECTRIHNDANVNWVHNIFYANYVHAFDWCDSQLWKIMIFVWKIVLIV